jgi:uncharacterized membrane protein
VRVLVAVVGLGYPLLVYTGLLLVEPRVLVGAAALVLLAHAVWSWRGWTRGDVLRVAVPAVLVAGVLVAAAVVDDGRVFLFVPALVNGAMLIGFARTLVRGPSMLETFARLRHPELPASRGPYLRAVTGVWCGFFIVNITISVLLALYSTLATWTVYNGILAYVLVGVLLAGERVYRYWRFRGYHGGRLDSLFRRVFPPPTAPRGGC